MAAIPLRALRASLSTLFFVSGALASAPPRSPVPLGPPEIHVRREPGPPLDMRMRLDPGFARAHPEAACATTRDLALASPHLAAREAASLAHIKSPASRRHKSGGAALAANVFVQDGIVVMENDGLMMSGDRPPDLAGQSMRLVPAGQGFSATLGPATYNPPTSAALFANETGGFKSWQVTLPFAFPFGGRSYTEAWMTNTGGVFFAAPAAPTSDQVVETQTLYDRTPRITPLLGGRSYYGHTGHYDSALTPVPYAAFTWVTGDVELQVTLQVSGVITMTWNRLNALHGTVAVVTGNDAFWASEAEVAAWSDPPAEVGIPAPDGPALEVLGVRIRQVPGTGVTRILLDLAGPLPTSGGNTFYYELMFYPDTASGTMVGYEYAQFRDGVQNGGAAFAVLNGSTLELGIPSWRFGVGQPSFDLRINTWWNNGGWQYGDGVQSPGVTLPSLGSSIQTDFSSELPKTSDAPLFESFTLPSLNTYAVYDAYRQAFGNPFIDSLAIWQNVYTDIIFFAGAYSTVGNAAADGIGVGSKSDPPSPALLHMNTIGYGWNANEGGRTTVINQEFGHHWAYFARFKEGGVTSTVLNPDGAHPAGWVHTPGLQDVLVVPDFSSFGGSFWTDNLDGSFTSSVNAWAGTTFWPVELYTMGLLDPSEVPDWFYLRDSDQPIANAYWAATNQTVRATRVPVNIQQIIDNEGPRDPAYPAAPRDFRAPFVLVVRPGTLAAWQSQEVAKYCTEWERNFKAGTWNRGTVSCFSRCFAPVEPVANTLWLVKGTAPGAVRYHWSNLAPPAGDYPIFEDTAKDGSYLTERGAGTDGAIGVELTLSAGSPLYYRVAGRNPPDCIGPK